MGLAVGVTIALGQLLRCLRPCDDPFPHHWF
jgi:hypothetical protein